MTKSVFLPLLFSLVAGCSGLEDPISEPVDIKPATEAELRSDFKLAQTTPPLGSKVLAVCGPSTGRAFYLNQTEGVVEDGISGGRTVFVADSSGNPDLLFKDSTGTFLSAKADGGGVFFSKKEENGNFGMFVVYPSTGVTETFNVATLSNGRKKALWTSNKPSTPATKVAAFVADCV